MISSCIQPVSFPNALYCFRHNFQFLLFFAFSTMKGLRIRTHSQSSSTPQFPLNWEFILYNFSSSYFISSQTLTFVFELILPLWAVKFYLLIYLVTFLLVATFLPTKEIFLIFLFLFCSFIVTSVKSEPHLDTYT